MRAGAALGPAVLIALVAACSSPEDAGAPPATADERRALAEARAMIPQNELPRSSPTPATMESAADDQ